MLQKITSNSVKRLYNFLGMYRSLSKKMHLFWQDLVMNSIQSQGTLLDDCIYLDVLNEPKNTNKQENYMNLQKILKLTHV